MNERDETLLFRTSGSNRANKWRGLIPPLLLLFKVGEGDESGYRRHRAGSVVMPAYAYHI